MGLLRLFCFCIFLVSTVLTEAQIGTAVFEQLNTDHGLPQNSVTSIIQDQYGFMWMGTQDGLCRYDGLRFKIFQSDKSDSTTISHNFIWDIYEDDRGIIWISTLGNGLNRLDPTTGIFNRYLHHPDDSTGLSNHNIFSTQWAGGYLWVGTNNGLDRLDENTGKCQHFFQRSDTYSEGKATNLIRTITFHPPSSLRLNTDRGLTLLNIETKEFEEYLLSPFGQSADLSDIRRLEQIEDWLYILTAKQLLRINFLIEKEEILLDVQTLHQNSTVTFSDFEMSNGFPEWIASETGIFRLNKTSGQIDHYTHNSDDIRSLAHNRVLSICLSDDGVLWAGTRNGLSKMNQTNPVFELFRKNGNTDFALGNKSVQCILEDQQQRLWVGTHEGINIIDRTSQTIQKLQHNSEDPFSLISDYVLSMSTDHQNRIWVGTANGGLHRIDDPNSSEKIPVKRFSPSLSSIHSLLPDDSLIWIGTGGDGLYKCDLNGNVLRHFPAKPDGEGPAHSYIYDIFKDSFENYWLATPTGGLQLFDPNEEKFIYIQHNPSLPTSLSGNTVLCIFEDGQNQLWVGTTSGVSRMDTPLEREMYHAASNHDYFRFSHFGRGQGLQNEVIYGMVEDNHGQLWMTTNNGMIHFDPEQEKVIRTYYREDGCQGNEYNQNAYGSNDRGELFFGGVDGMHIFHPDSLRSLQYVPPVYLTDILLNYESVPYVSGNDFVLGSAPHLVKNLELAYNQNVVGFEFAALSFANSSRNLYAWMLEGFDTDWNYASQNRLVSYTNLDPGAYTFRVKASNSDGFWNETGTFVNIAVQNPPWKSWYAYLFYALLVFGVFYIIVKTRTQKAIRQMQLQVAVKQAREEERELFRKKSAQDFHDEAGNKITRINLLVELLRSESNDAPKLQEFLDKIGKNTAELSSGMRDFNWAIDPDKDDLYELVVRIQSFGQSMFEGNRVAFLVKDTGEIDKSLKLPMQMRRDLLLIFKEAINNAARHSGAQRVEFSAEVSNGVVHLCLTDDGCGYSTQTTGVSGYGLRNMHERAARHHIDLDISSNPDSGTSICTSFKIPQMRDSEKESIH